MFEMVSSRITMISTYKLLAYHYNKKHIRGSTQATIHPLAIILTKAHKTAVSMMAKGCDKA